MKSKGLLTLRDALFMELATYHMATKKRPQGQHTPPVNL